MATFIFDFDSTLLNCESLEKLLKPTLERDSKTKELFISLTEQGMNGEISFEDSLKKRLELAHPHWKEIEHFVSQSDSYWTHGMKPLLKELSKAHSVWILTGGLEVLVKKMCQGLLPLQHIFGVKAEWDHTGAFIGIDPSNPFSKSKLIGAKTILSQWPPPTLLIGDSMADYALYEEGLVDHFIAYTEHIKRDKLIDKASHIANNVTELIQRIECLLSS